MPIWVILFQIFITRINFFETFPWYLSVKKRPIFVLKRFLRLTVLKFIKHAEKKIFFTSLYIDKNAQHKNSL